MTCSVIRWPKGPTFALQMALKIKRLNRDPQWGAENQALPAIRKLLHEKFGQSSVVNAEEVMGQYQAFSSPRQILSQHLTKQYAGLDIEPAVHQNLEKLAKANSFTFCTGHQLSIYGGPAMVWVKIASAIAYARKLAAEVHQSIVPVFWMASEDHDFEEISEVKIYGKKFKWEIDGIGGAVGRMGNSGLEKIGQALSQLNNLHDSAGLIELMRDAYRSTDTLAQSTFKILNSVFGKWGLVVLDADSPELKAAAKELFVLDAAGKLFDAINQSGLDSLSPAPPRPINQFYIGADGIRQRIDRMSEDLRTKDGTKRWNLDAYQEELSAHPDRFSPNVVLRTLYQQWVLPNLAYIGGPAEVAYWQSYFPAFRQAGVPYPQIMNRDSVLPLGKKAIQAIEKSGMDLTDLLTSPESLEAKFYDIKLGGPHPAEVAVDVLQEKALELKDSVQSLGPKMASQTVEMLKGLNKELKKLKTEIQSTHRSAVEGDLAKLKKLATDLKPEGGLQERSVSILQFIADFGMEFLDQIILNFVPREECLTVITRAEEA